ncbi:FtsX-like permease family protein [Paenibacillus methanolicus]|uniref:Putative ABC transport system permease protein n=1 Tax=Paenibacillus methanolicus TaxID=582686 RepID=A0A5S5C0R1_9BACL|nr:ABC transporter permease [Paenibacillus methanolicus]TYP73025.1 putative ABC transport system permease protein [Paenibacillus methanolicus]
MTLFSVARKNIAGNFKSYLLYLVSMVFSIVIYFTFVSLQYSTEIASAIQSSRGVQSIFLQASILLILFAAVFIWYSSSFFNRRRKKEIGLYSLLGVRKRTIGWMMFYENMIMGALALAVGIVIGALLSKLFTLMMLRLLDSAVEISFALSPAAIGNTVIVFAILIVVTSIRAYLLIYRFRLIELFQAEKQAESRPKGSPIVAILAVVVLAASYWLILQPIATSQQFSITLLVFMIGVISGTYLLFRFGAVRFLLVLAKNKASYYQGVRFVGAAQLLFRMAGHVRMLTVVSLLSAVTIIAVSIGASAYYEIEREAARTAPFSYAHLSKGDKLDAEIERVITADKEHPIIAKLDIPILGTTADASELAVVPSKFTVQDVPVKLMSAATFNAIADALGRDEQVRLTGLEAAIVQPLDTDHASDDYVGRSITLKQAGEDRNVTFGRFIDERVMNWSFPDLIVVVSEELYGEFARQSAPAIYKAYKVEDERSARATSEALLGLDAKEAELTVHYAEYRGILEAGGVNLFVLGFLGLVFMAATGSIIYFKQLTEAQSDSSRYAILRNIGVSRREISISIAMQSLFVFGLPLAVGILHSALFLQVLMNFNLIGKEATIPIVMSIAAYAIIYTGYYGLTVQSCRRIVEA